MAIDLNDALVLDILLSVRQDPNTLTNVDYIKNTDYATAAANPITEPRGRGFLGRVSQASYERAQANLLASDPSSVNNDARALTSSIERLTTAGAEEPWDGSGLHPPVETLAMWINAIKPGA